MLSIVKPRLSKFFNKNDESACYTCTDVWPRVPVSANIYQPLYIKRTFVNANFSDIELGVECIDKCDVQL